MFEDYREAAKVFKEVANILEDLADLEDRGKEGEDVEEAMETALGKLMIKVVKMQGLK